MGLETAFELGRLYQPIKTIADTLQSSQDKIFLELPGLIAWFPGGVTSDNGHMVNTALFPTYMEQQGTCPIGYDSHPYRTTGNGTNYLKTGGLAPCLGTETWIDAPLRGLTIGCWLKLVSLPASLNAGVMGKNGPPTELGYSIQVHLSGTLRWIISGNGSSAILVDTGVLGLGVWAFVCARFDPSVEIAIFLNGTKTINVSGVPAALNASTSNFEVGRTLDTDTRIGNFQTRDIFVCQSALSDDLIATIMATSSP